MTITVNGKPMTLDDETRLDALIAQLGLSDRPVAAEINRQLVPKKKHTSTSINDGDSIELVTLVGGG